MVFVVATMIDEKRIKLAEAMGWRLFKDRYWQPPNVTREFADSLWGGPVPINWDATPLPDPFTDANDDYAVLEWARTDNNQIIQKWHSFIVALSVKPCGLYQVGDYARAALKVLDD